MHTKIEKNIFVFPIYPSELSLLRREYLSLAVNVSTKSLKNLHVTTSDFFRLDYLHSDQRIS